MLDTLGKLHGVDELTDGLMVLALSAAEDECAQVAAFGVSKRLTLGGWRPLVLPHCVRQACMYVCLAQTTPSWPLGCLHAAPSR